MVGESSVGRGAAGALCCDAVEGSGWADRGRWRLRARWGIARLLAASALAALAVPAPAGAHALLVESLPAEAAVLPAAPTQLVLRFNSRIEHKLSQAALIDGAGARRPLAMEADAPPDRLIAALPALAPGSYTVDWQVLSVDGHRVAGQLHFSVASPG